MATQRSVKIERGIYRVTHGELTFFRVQLSGRKVSGQRLSKSCETYDEAQEVKRVWLATRGAPLERLAPVKGEAPPTVEDGVRAYLDSLAARRKDTVRAAQVGAVIQRRLPALWHTPLHAVTVADLYAFRHTREDAGTKPNTIIRDLRVLRAMLKIARPELKIPAKVFPPENLTRLRVLQPADEAKVFPLLREPFRTIARVAALTLMRLSEIRTLEVAMVRVAERVIALPTSKTGPGTVILGTEALRLLEAQIATLPGGARYVFPNREGRPYTYVHVSRVWRIAARKAGLQNFTFHDLRHHGAVVVLNNGASDRVLMRLGRWRRSEQIERYGFIADARSLEAANSIANGMQYRHER